MTPDPGHTASTVQPCVVMSKWVHGWIMAGVVSSIAVACSDDGASGTTALGSGSGEAGEAGTLDGGGDGDGGVRLDTPGGATAGTADDGNNALGCEKVDLLFVIDDSISMAGEQANLIASFPDFIDGIRTQLDGVTSYHVGVVTTNAYAFNDGSCQQIGALVTETGGASSSNQACGPFAQGRYLTELDDLETEFGCIGQVGIDGPTDERPMQAMQVAVGPALAGAGNCNAGFIRDDALLVVVVVTDEEDDHKELYGMQEGSPGDPSDWFDALVAAKGFEQNVAVLSIIGGEPGNVCPAPSGADGAEDAPRLRAFTQLFSNGFLGDVCAPSYGPFFADAIGVVETACGGFIPPAG